MIKKHSFSFSKALSLFLVAALFMGMFTMPALAAETQTETAHYIDSDGETIADSTKSSTEVYEAPSVDGYTYSSQSVATTNVYAEQHITYIIGYPDGGVKVENNMTRAEAVVVLYRLYNGNIPSFTKRMSNDTFADVDSSAWYYKELETLYNVGIIADDGAFRPDEPITRAEFATLCARYDGLTYLDKAKFSDAQTGHPAYSYINAAAEAGWIVGYPDGTFRPDNNITRAEVMTLVNRLFNRIPSTEQIAHVKNPYNDIVSTHWAYCNVIEATVKHDTVDWHGAEYNDGVYNIIVEKFVDTSGKEIAKSVTTEGKVNYHPAAINGYSYLGYITEITYVYTNGKPAPGIVKTSNASTAAVGDTVTYTITLKNDKSATDAWRDVVLTDVLPEHMSLVHGSVYLGSDHADYSIKNNRLTVSVGDIAAGKTAKVSFDVIVLSTAYGETITNKATGKGSNGSAVTDTDDGITIEQGEIQPFIIKTADTDSAVVGQTITYTLSIGNGEGATYPWTKAVITDAIPAELAFQDGSVYLDDATAAYSYKNGTLTVPLGSIAPGENRILTFKAVVLETAYGMTLYNTAVGTGDNIPEIKAPDDGIEIAEGVTVPGITKTASVSTANAGDTVTYTINLSNGESATAVWRDVIAIDEIPEHMGFVHGSVYLNGKHTDYNLVDGLLSVPVGDIAAGESVKVTFGALVLSTAYGETISNTATGTGSNGGPVSDTDDGVTVLQGEIQPYISKSPNVGYAVVGQTITYTLSLGNGKGATYPWENAVITDVIPTGLSFVDGSVYLDGATAAYSYKSDTLSVSLGNIAPGESHELTFKAVVLESAYGTTVYNTAVGTGDNTPDIEAPDTGVVVSDGEAVPSASKTASVATAAVGDTIIYTIDAKNGKDATAAWLDATISDTIPDNTEFVYGSVQIDGVGSSAFSFAGNELKIFLGDIEAGKTVSATFAVTIKADAYGKTITNHAILSGGNTSDIPVQDGGVAVSDGMTAPYASKSASVSTANVGDTITYTVVVGNEHKATVDWENVVMNDVISSYLTFVQGSVQVNGKTTAYSYRNSNLSVELGDIALDGKVTVTFDAVVNSTAYNKTISNTAIMTGDNTTEPVEASDSGVTVGKGASEGTAIKYADKTTASVGETITYTVNVRNSALATYVWENATITDVIPEHLSFVDGSVAINQIGTSSYFYDGTTLKVYLGNLAAGESAVVTFRCAVDEGAQGLTIYNTAEVTGDNIAPITAPDRGVEIESGEPIPAATKSASVAEAAVGEKVSYTFTLSNSVKATADWRNVAISDVIPSGMDFVHGSVYVNGVSATYSLANRALTIPLGNIAPGESVTVIFEVMINNDAQGTTVYNTALIGSDNAPDKPVTDSGVTVPEENFGGDSENSVYGSKVADKINVQTGDLIEYTIVAGNSTNNDFTWYDVHLYDIIDTSLSKIVIDTVTIDGRKANDTERTFSNGTLVVRLGAIQPGQEITVTFKVKVTSEAAGEIISNTATLKGSNASGGTYNTAVRISLETGIPSESEKENELSDIHFALFVGYPDGEWKPDNYLSRAELATIYYRILSKPAATGSRSITDIDASHWAYTEIQFALSKNLLYLDNGAFNPDDSCTRADLGRLFSFVFGEDFGFTGSDYITRINTARAIVEYSSRHKEPITNGASLISFSDITSSYPYYWIVMEVSNDHDWYLDSNEQEYWDN